MAKKQSALAALKSKFTDIEREVVDGETIILDKISSQAQEQLATQVNAEYDLAYPFNAQKRRTNLARLKLYNNQRRTKDSVGDPLMFTVFNTILASLYDDRLMVEWEGKEEGDEDAEENLNGLSKHDYKVMGKSKFDYFWDWDTLFFGRGLALMMDFDRTPGIMAPVPELLDASTFIRDPKAGSVNGLNTRGVGGMRFGGLEVGATYYNLKGLPGYFNIDSLRKEHDVQSLIDEASRERNEAQGRDEFYPAEENLGIHDNYRFHLLNWFTTIKGEKYMVTLGNRRSTVVKLVKLKYNNRWPIIDRSIWPMSNDWDGVSIPDITEDKQRSRAKLLNLGVKSAVIDTLPQYVFDQSRIKNKNDLNWKKNKFIGVDGRVDNVMAPVQKSTVHQYVNSIMDMMDQSVQRATATPEVQQGMTQDKQRTLGELQLVSSKVDTRYSMSAKIFGWSEEDFWRQWYLMYKIHYKEGIDEKVIRLKGPMGPRWRKLLRENFIATHDPDLSVESKAISEAKRERDLMKFQNFAAIAIQNPENDRRHIERTYGKLSGMNKDQIDAMFPPTVDEMQAEQENIRLEMGSLPKINAQDNHQVHIRIHSKTNMTTAALAHIEEHRELMIEKRNNPEIFPPDQMMPPAMPGQPQGQPQLGQGQPLPVTPTQ